MYAHCPSELRGWFKDVFHFVLGALGPGSITGPQTRAPALRLGFVALFPLAVPSKNTGFSNQPWGSQGFSQEYIFPLVRPTRSSSLHLKLF